MDLIEPTLIVYVNFIFIVLTLPFWLMRIVKVTLFYLYLWQLKEYHIGRFLDHFRTDKGKRLLLNKILLGEILLLVFPISFFFFILYGLGALKTGLDLIHGRLRKPVLTKKILPLIGLNITLAILFLIILAREDLFSGPNIIRLLVLYGVLVPVITSAVVLAFQPLVVLARNRIIRQATAKRKTFRNLKVIGITGSYGKTSTKEFLTHILSQKFQVLKTPEHQNSEIGISNTILKSVTDNHEIFVCEMGAYNKRGIALLADIAKPYIGIVTGVNEQHLATFGSMENLLSAEGGQELLKALPKNGVMIVNAASALLRSEIPNLKKMNKDITFIAATEDIEAKNVKIEKERVSFMIGETRFQVQTRGAYNVENLLLAIAAANELGMSLEEIAEACKTITQEFSVIKLREGVNGLHIIDSTHSANPDGVIADLEYLNLWEGKKIIVMPCIIELGKASKKVHKRIGEKIGEVCDLAIITTKECFADIKEGAGGTDKVLFMESAQEILEKIKGADAILLEGGKESRLQRQLVNSLNND